MNINIFLKHIMAFSSCQNCRGLELPNQSNNNLKPLPLSQNNIQSKTFT